jgi:hypothetical protein
MKLRKGKSAGYRRLDSHKIVETVQALCARVERRFPESGLSRVAAELLQVAQETVPRIEWIQRPRLGVRIGALILSGCILALLIGLFGQIRRFQFDDYTNSVQALEASLSAMVFIGAALFFLLNWEGRLKRSRALKALHELRALAHIIDMHQLSKDPESYFGEARLTSKRKRDMTPFELNRYLDYCSDAMALISKIAALYVQDLQDPVLLNAVDDVEDLTTGFSRKIWQKISSLDDMRRSMAGQGADSV